MNTGVFIVNLDKPIAVCECGEVIPLKYWHISSKSLTCKKCKNDWWEISRSQLNNWFKVSTDIDSELTSDSLIYIKQDVKRKVTEDYQIETKTTILKLVLDLKNNEIYVLKDDSPKKYKPTKNYNGLGNRFCGNQFRSIIEIYNKTNPLNPIDINLHKEYLTLKQILDIMNNLFEYPQLSLISNLHDIFVDVAVDNLHLIDITQTSPSKILGTTKKHYQQIKQKATLNDQGYYPTRYTYQDLETEKKFLEKYPLNQLNQIKEFGIISISDAIFFLDRNYKLNSILKYLQSLINTNNQPANRFTYTRTTTVTYLKDYIRMSESLGLKYEKYPSNLKDKHDNVMHAYNTIIQEGQNINLQKVYEPYKKYEYTNEEQKEFSIITPENSKQIVQEGIDLNHCVGSYLQSVLKGDTLIFFMRQKDNINKPYLTLEVKGNRIVQAKKNSNKIADAKEKKFITEWAQENKLQVCGF